MVRYISVVLMNKYLCCCLRQVACVYVCMRLFIRSCEYFLCACVCDFARVFQRVLLIMRVPVCSGVHV